MRYLSVCSGIEAATVAWHPLGWEPAGFAEIERFPSAVLAHHYPDVPNLGDMTRYREWPDVRPDLVVGGTPCQSFSVAGLRRGLADPRGNLTLTFLGVVDRYRPRWVVWENVPGVRSADAGRALGALLGGLAELGYGWAFRCLDAQYFGLAQRRDRLFVVGHLGDWSAPAEVLLEPHSLSGHPAPRREAGQRIAPTLESRAGAGGGAWGTDFLFGGGMTAFGGNNRSGPIEVATAVLAKGGTGRLSFESETFVAGALLANAKAYPGQTMQDAMGGLLVTQAFKASHFTRGKDGAPAVVEPPLSADADKGDQDTLVLDRRIAFAIQERAVCENPDAGPDGVGVRGDGLSYTVEARSVPQAVAFVQNGRSEVRLQGGDGSVAGALARDHGAQQRAYVASAIAVRRLTPRECERLQGFPDDYTLVPYRRKLAADGPRYRAIGNSMAVPVMRWIGQRIAAVDVARQEVAA